MPSSILSNSTKVNALDIFDRPLDLSKNFTFVIILMSFAVSRKIAEKIHVVASQNRIHGATNPQPTSHQGPQVAELFFPW